MNHLTYAETSSEITTIFTDIVNSWFSTGVFPDPEKYVVVKQFFKADKDRNELSSYRLSFNTSFLSKVLETACVKQLNNHLDKMPALQNLHSAYRRSNSDETAVTKVYNDPMFNKSRRKDTIIVLFDWSAAFNTFDQDIHFPITYLLFGIGDIVLEWFRVCLMNV